MHIDNSSDTKSTSEKSTSLIRKLDVPVEHLDYDYVQNCADVKEIEKILRILRSGEEGRYEDLERFVENRLRTLQPNNKQLRVEVPILTRTALERSEIESIDSDLLDWIHEVEKNEEKSEICAQLSENDKVPVRGSQIVIATEESAGKSEKADTKEADGFLKHRNPDHIKSWEYDKWAKFNIDAELTKLDIEDMKAEELRQQRARTMQQMKNNTECKPEADISTSTKQIEPQNASPKNSPGNAQLGPSYIEEIPETVEAKSEPDVKSMKPQDLKPRRRFKVMIEDINISSLKG